MSKERSYLAHPSALDLPWVIASRAEAGSTIRTDGWKGYCGLDQIGFTHRPEISLGRHRRALAQFKLVHRQFSNLKSWLLGTHRNTCRRHLDLYTAEFNWRTNRRGHPINVFISLGVHIPYRVNRIVITLERYRDWSLTQQTSTSLAASD